MSGKKPSTVRRKPTQARSIRRYNALVDAAAALFAEVGFDAATTEQIAARAESSIGSLYQFFPNKSSLFAEVATRSMQAFEDKFSDLFTLESLKDDWQVLIERAVNGFADLQFGNPYVRAASMNMSMWGEYATEDIALQKRLITAIGAIFALKAPQLDLARRELAAAMVLHTMSVMLYVAWREERMRHEIVAETQTMLIRYLTPYLSQPVGN